jgi:hypothetical protein
LANSACSVTFPAPQRRSGKQAGEQQRERSRFRNGADSANSAESEIVDRKPARTADDAYEFDVVRQALDSDKIPCVASKRLQRIPYAVERGKRD